MQASADKTWSTIGPPASEYHSDFDAVFEHIAHLQDGALAIGADAFFTSHLQELANLALRRAVPAAYQFREFAAAGGLFSYGASLTDTFRFAGMMRAELSKAIKLDLPVQQATKVELTDQPQNG